MSHSKELHHFYQGCNEILHGQTRSHLHITIKTYVLPFLSAIKLYTPLYLITHIIGRKSLQQLITRTLPDIVRSSAFLSCYSGTFMAMQCLLLSLTHRAYRIIWFGSYFVSAFISMFVEHKARRQELAVYVSNVGIDALFRMLVARAQVRTRFLLTFFLFLPLTHQEGYAKPINNTMGLIFAVCWAVLSYYHKHSPAHLNGAIKSIVGIFNGSDDKPNLIEKQLSRHNLLEAKTEGEKKLVSGTDLIIRTLTKFIQSFVVGFGVKGLLALVSNVTRIRNFITLKKSISKSFGKQQMQFGLFIGSLSSLSLLVSGILRAVRRKDDAVNTIVGGFFAGLSSYLSSSVDMSMYMFSKVMQTVLSHLTDLKVIKPIRFSTELVYAFFTAVLFYAGFWEPQNLRPSYLTFLYRISGGIWKEFLASNKGLRLEFESAAWKLTTSSLLITCAMYMLAPTIGFWSTGSTNTNCTKIV